MRRLFSRMVMLFFVLRQRAILRDPLDHDPIFAGCYLLLGRSQLDRGSAALASRDVRVVAGAVFRVSLTIAFLQLAILLVPQSHASLVFLK